MTTLTSIVLPVHTLPEARHVVIDEDGNQIAVCGPLFAELDGSGRLLQQAEAIAAELVRVLNAHDGLVAALETADKKMSDFLCNPTDSPAEHATRTMLTLLSDVIRPAESS